MKKGSFSTIEVLNLRHTLKHWKIPSTTAMFGSSFRAALVVVFAFCPQILGRWWGPINMIYRSMNMYRDRDSTWRWWGHLNTQRRHSVIKLI